MNKPMQRWILATTAGLTLSVGAIASTQSARCRPRRFE